MVHNPISLKNICDKKLKKYTSCHNALDVLIVAHILKMGPLCEKAKEFIWTNKSNEVLKSNWKKLEKENPNFFKKCVMMMLDIHDWQIEHLGVWGLELTNTLLFATADLTLEDICLAVMEDGLMMNNVIRVLMAAQKLDARKIVQKASEFIWNNRKCKFMKNQWKDLEEDLLPLFLDAGKTIFQY